MLQKKSLVRKTAALFLCLLLISFSGCKAPENTTSSDSVTFTDSLGREVSVPKGTLNAAVLVGSLADIWHLAGGNITATAEDAWEDFDLCLPDAINLGTVKKPDTELLLISAPSFVIASSNTTSNIELLPILESAKITVAYFDIASFSDYLDMLMLCTEITGRKDLYKKNGTDVKNKIDSLKKDFNKKTIPENERKYLFLRASSGLIKAKGSDSYVLGSMLSDLGYENIADSDESLLENLSIETIIKENPYRIFISQMGDDTEATKKNIEKMFSENPSWSYLSAVKEGRVHFMDKRLFSLKPNAKWGESYEILTYLLEN